MLYNYYNKKNKIREVIESVVEELFAHDEVMGDTQG